MGGGGGGSLVAAEWGSGLRDWGGLYNIASQTIGYAMIAVSYY